MSKQGVSTSTGIRASERDSREKLIRAAKIVFAREGYDGATVKAIADEAKVNISLISYYFGGKEGLYRSCLEEAGRVRLLATERIFVGPHSLEGLRVRLRLFVEEFFLHNMEERDVSQILQRECGMSNPITKDIFASTFLVAYRRIVQFFKDAQSSGILRKDIDVEVMAGLLFGALMNFVRFEPISKEFFGKSVEDREYRDNITRHITENFLQGFIA